MLSPPGVNEILATVAAFLPWDLSWLRAHISLCHPRQTDAGALQQRTSVGWNYDSLALWLPTACFKALQIQNTSLGEAQKAVLTDSSLGYASVKVCHCLSDSKFRSVRSQPTTWSWKTGGRSNLERNVLIWASDNRDFNWAL